MTTKLERPKRATSLIACLLTLVMPIMADDKPGEKPAGDDPVVAAAAATTTVPTSEFEQLKKMLLDQQRQLDELRRQIAGQKAEPMPAATPVSAPSARPSLGEIASTTPILPPSPAPVPSSSPVFNPKSSPSTSSPADDTSPLQLKIGDAYITPLGFMDMTSVSRSVNAGTGIGTNFGSIPYGNTQAGALTETRFSPQNSRIGARIDAIAKGWNIMGYWESDFLGQTAAPVNGGLAVSSNPYVFRMRLYWVDARKGKFEFLAGQSWSLMTPNRVGISPLPSDLFYSQDIDVNYQVGLTWGRIPGYRFGFHPNSKVAIGISLENSEPYVGGANGGSAAVLPALIGAANAVSGAVLGGQINNGQSTISSAALAPDIIAKIAFDPNSRLHFEIAGVEIADKFANPTTTPAFQTNTKIGGGGSVNLNFALTKNFRLITNNFWSDGGGRYIFGQAPDFILRGDGNISLVHSGSTASGFEATVGRHLFYAYYGGVYVSRNMALDANGTTKIGYGPIASDGQNRAIQEITFGSNTTLMKDVKWGALNLMFQYSYLQRNPWLAATGAPSNAHADMGFVNFRYTLPGIAPTMAH